MLRVLGFRIHRTFPELDGIPDDAQRAIVSRALQVRGAGRFLQASARWTLSVLAGLLAGAAALAFLAWSLYRSYGWPFGRTLREVIDEWEWGWPWLVRWPQVLVAAAVGLAVFLLVLRFLSRSAFRRVLRRRGLCDFCGYGISGLAVNEAGCVRCPECSRESRVMAEWGESSGGVFVPRTGLKPPQYWTRRRVVEWGVSLVLAAGVVAVVVAAPAVMRHWRVTSDARAAEKELVTVERFRLIQPASKAQPGWPNAGEKIRAVRLVLRSHEARVKQSDPALAHGVFDPSLLLPTTRELSEEDALNARFSGLVFERWVADNGFEQLRTLSGPVDFSFVPTVDKAGIVTNFDTTELANSRLVARLCRAMERRALRAGNVDAWRVAAMAHVGVARAAGESPTIMGRLTMKGIEWNLLNGVQERLFEVRVLPSGDKDVLAWLDAVDAVLLRGENGAVPVQLALDGERLSMQHEVAKIFADPSNVERRLAREAKKGSLEGRVGRFAENRAVVDALYDSIVEASKRAPVEQSRALGEKFTTDLQVVMELAPAVGKFLRDEDASEQYRIAVATMVALERHRQTTGAFPATLAELKTPPVVGMSEDRFAPGQKLCYRPIVHADGRPWYVLYSVGLDGKDDGGAGTPVVADAFYPGGKGKDAVYSVPEP